MTFAKMHGIGNDFVMLDGIKETFTDEQLNRLAVAMCDRRFGVGSDGIILACRGTCSALRMRMFNPDGTEGEMCGNGVRCLARFLVDQGYAQGPEIEVETGAGVLSLRLLDDGQVTANMGKARLTRGEIGMLGPSDEEFLSQPIAADSIELNGTAVSMGNPHIVFIVDDVNAVPLENWGPLFENHPLFPNRTNVHFVQVLSRSHLKQRTWERGAGITLACGTGACSCAVAAFLNGKSERVVKVSLPGGDLWIDYKEDGTVLMTGPVETVFKGDWLL